MKPKVFNWDWKESPEQVVEDLKPILASKGLYLQQDPLWIGTDTVGYILTDNKQFTVGDYRKILRGCDQGILDWFDEICVDECLTNKDFLTKFCDLL
jgi:hypothetical protein